MAFFEIPAFRFRAVFRASRNSHRIAAAAVLMVSALPLAAEAGAATALGVVVKPQCEVAVVSSSVGSTGGTLVFRYWLRTSPGGSGALMIHNTPAGLSYEVIIQGSVSSSGPISNAPSVSLTAFPGGSHTNREGNLGILRWTSSAGDLEGEVPDLAIECR
jgi:hypothetical protein